MSEWGWRVKTRLSSPSTLPRLATCCMAVQTVLKNQGHRPTWVWKWITSTRYIEKPEVTFSEMDCSFFSTSRAACQKCQCIRGKSILLSTAECLSPVALRRVSRRCHGRTNCSVLADTKTFGDPCFSGTRKHLRVSFTCGKWWAVMLPTEAMQFAA